MHTISEDIPIPYILFTVMSKQVRSPSTVAAVAVVCLSVWSIVGRFRRIPYGTHPLSTLRRQRPTRSTKRKGKEKRFHNAKYDSFADSPFALCNLEILLPFNQFQSLFHILFTIIQFACKHRSIMMLFVTIPYSFPFTQNCVTVPIQSSRRV